MDKKQKFPFILQQASIEEKKNYFLKRNINHPILNDVFLTLMEKIESSFEGKLYLVFGPTGVGKSTLCKRVKSEIISNHQTIIQNDSGIIPVISLELPSPDNGRFNWKDFYKRMLREMNEPLIDKKISYSNKLGKKNIPNHFPNTAPELRESLESAIIHRKTKIILLDEAQHLLKVAGARGIQDQMDAIKSLANLTGSVFVLFGTYELMGFFDLNGQLGRRTDEVHFRRYNLEDSQDLLRFKSVINTFQNQLPLKGETDLIPEWEFMYERTIGCIGILKEWLNVCLIETLNKNLPVITHEILKKHAPMTSKALKIAEEAINGERKIERQEEDSFQLQNLLGLNKKRIEEKSNQNNKANSIRKNVGKRNPSRDEIGITENQA